MIKAIVKARAEKLLIEIEDITNLFMSNAYDCENSTSILQKIKAETLPPKTIKRVRSIMFQLTILQMIFAENDK